QTHHIRAGGNRIIYSGPERSISLPEPHAKTPRRRHRQGEGCASYNHVGVAARVEVPNRNIAMLRRADCQGGRNRIWRTLVESAVPVAREDPDCGVKVKVRGEDGN